MEKTYAIIIPYRDRKEHLDTLLKSFEKYKEPDKYGNIVKVIIVEQDNDYLFNRGQLFNSAKLLDYDYFIFHDVDLIPDPNVNYIRKYTMPTHLSCYCEQFNYKLLDIENEIRDYKKSKMFGGVVAMSKNDFLKLNGYSNIYEGWGCEDNDLMTRIEYKHMKYDRLPWTYKSLTHKHNDVNNINLLNNLNKLEKFDNHCPDIYYDMFCNQKTFSLIPNQYKGDVNIGYYKVNTIPVYNYNIFVVYKDLMLKQDFDMCLLYGVKYHKNILITNSEYKIEQSFLNYYANSKTSKSFNNNTILLKWYDVRDYMLDIKTSFNLVHQKFIRWFTSYDYINHSLIKHKILSPAIEKSLLPKFNYFLYILLNDDIAHKCHHTENEMYKHYINCGINENRKMSFGLPNDFDVYEYYELNKDLRYMNLYNLSLHYLNQGKKENRLYKIESAIKIRNIDWTYYQARNKSDMIKEYLKSSLEHQYPLKNYTFINNKPGKESRILIVTHPGGGGVEKYMNMLLKYIDSPLILKPNCDKNYLYEIESKYFHEQHLDDLYTYLSTFNITQIIINHTFLFMPQVLKMIEQLQDNNSCEMISILHDLTFKNHRNKKSILYTECRHNLLKRSKKIISPSQYLTNQYNYVNDIITMGHPDMIDGQSLIKVNPFTDKFIILIFGDNKGVNEIKEFINTMDDSIMLLYIGNINIRHSKLHIIANIYNDSDIMNLIEDCNPHLIWFPSKKPESYCYALSYAIRSGFPIVTHSIGAFIERLCNRVYSWLIPIESKLIDHIEQIKKSFMKEFNIDNYFVTSMIEEEYINVILSNIEN